MSAIHIACPGCKTPLIISAEHLGKQGRCRSCGFSFPINDPNAVVKEADIADWLLAESESAPPKVTPPTPHAPHTLQAHRDPSNETHVHLHPHAPPHRVFPVRLDHVDAMGAFFHFDSQLLYEEDFRAVFPQQCIICGSKQRLNVYLLFWSSKLQDRAPKHHDPKGSVVPLEQLGNASGKKLLAQLHPHKNLAAPYSLPMPYYVCPNCPPVGAVMAEVNADAQGRQRCVLGFCSLPQAEAFLATVRGPDCPDLQRIRDARSADVDEWQILPLTVRIRIGQWFKPKESEPFLLYMPDLEFSKAEAGLAGVVATDRRLVYHKGPKNLDMAYRDHITLHFKPAEKHMSLQLRCDTGASAALLTNDDCIQKLRHIIAGHR